MSFVPGSVKEGSAGWVYHYGVPAISTPRLPDSAFNICTYGVDASMDIKGQSNEPLENIPMGKLRQLLLLLHPAV